MEETLSLKNPNVGQCCICHKVYDLGEFDLTQEIPQLMKEHEICFKCAFWHWRSEYDKTCEKEKGIIPFVINRYHYSASKDSIYAGLDYQHLILRSDGKLFNPPRLYHQGEIPSGFHYTFPNNAIFLNHEELAMIKNLESSKGLGLGLITVPENVVERLFKNFYKSK